MNGIKVSGVKNEVVAFIDRRATELSKISGRNVSRNEYINLILEKQLRDNLSLDDKLDSLNEKFDLLVEVIKEDRHATDRLMGLVVHGYDIDEE